MLFLVLLLPLHHASGLIISTDQDLSDTQSAAGFPYWDNVGWRGAVGTAIYLGDSWVLTAYHVLPGAVELAGTIYDPIPDSEQRIGNADILVFRIHDPPDLPPIPITDAVLTNGMVVRMFGTGKDQQAVRLYWEVDILADPWIWTPSSKNKADAWGIPWAANRVKCWGTNEIFDMNGTDAISTKNFTTSFDVDDTTYEGQGAEHDSGGPVFIDNQGVWELAGIMLAISTWSGQPDGTAVDYLNFGPPIGSLGGNQTVIADLGYYRQDIMNATPEPAMVEGRWVFYNNSAFDGDDAGANSDDDTAVDSSKSALLPGQTASFANYISYVKGINGVMVDIQGLHGTPTTEDFDIQVSGVSDGDGPGDYVPGPIPTSITTRTGAGIGESDRVTLIFPETDAYNSRWMRVTVKATAATGLIVPDVFYFGLAVGETGNSAADTNVDASDRLGCRANLNPGFPTPEPVTSQYDFNRDGKVDASDRLIAREHVAGFLNNLKLITAP
ncbi:MAG: hypothetical protein ACYSTL_06865 [Planctomycetota bacterium]|jgi:hypothetical protein